MTRELFQKIESILWLTGITRSLTKKFGTGKQAKERQNSAGMGRGPRSGEIKKSWSAETMSENWKLRFVLCKSKNRIVWRGPKPQARQADRREAHGRLGLVRAGGGGCQISGTYWWVGGFVGGNLVDVRESP